MNKKQIRYEERWIKTRLKIKFNKTYGLLLHTQTYIYQAPDQNVYIGEDNQGKGTRAGIEKKKTSP
jgi:hypothetical protein